MTTAMTALAAWVVLSAAGPPLGPPSPYVVEPPDILSIEVAGLPRKKPPVQGEYLVRPDGTVSFGEYGRVAVAGLTLEQARDAVARHLQPFAKKRAKFDVALTVAAANSKVYYVISEGEGGGEQITRLAWTGSGTVLDAVALVPGLVAAEGKVWVVRRNPDGGDRILPVDWTGIARQGLMATNYQILPGDRVYVTVTPAAKRAAWWRRTLGLTGPK